MINMPLVIQSAWDDGLGNVGVFAVNTQANAVTLRIPVPEPGRWHAAVMRVQPERKNMRPRRATSCLGI